MAQFIQLWLGQNWVFSNLNRDEIIFLDQNHSRRKRLEKEIFDRGLASYEKHDWEQAIADFTELLKIAPNRGLAYRARGKVYRKKERYAEAIADFTRAIELEINVYYDRGICYEHLGEYDLAFSDLTRAIRKKPDYAPYYRYRAWISYLQKDTEAAVIDLDEAIRLKPDHIGQYHQRGFYHHAKGNYSDAVNDYQKALLFDDECAGAHNNLAWLLATCPENEYRNGQKAVEHALKAVEYAEGKHLAYIGTLAAAYAETGNFAEAIRWANVFLDSNPPAENIELARLRLSLYEQGQPYRQEKGKLETVKHIRQTPTPSYP